jgi:hypothetical protein
MNNLKILQSALFASSLLACTAFAQSDTVTASSDSNPAPAVQVVNPAPVPNQVIYLPQLPNPGELTKAAAAQGIEIQQINQTANQLVVVYRYSNGQSTTIAYQLLASASTAPVVAPGAVATATPAPTVIYTTPRYYYEPYYDPWPWFAPVTIGLGFDYGFRHGGYFHGGGFRGGHFRGGGGFHGHH